MSVAISGVAFEDSIQLWHLFEEMWCLVYDITARKSQLSCGCERSCMHNYVCMPGKSVCTFDKAAFSGV